MIERRPDAAGRSTVAWPKEWGEPPENDDELRAWVLRNVERTSVGTSQGTEQSPTLAPASGRRAAEVGRVTKRG